jgi:hypothetical protein
MVLVSLTRWVAYPGLLRTRPTQRTDHLYPRASVARSARIGLSGGKGEFGRLGASVGPPTLPAPLPLLASPLRNSDDLGRFCTPQVWSR